MAASTEVDHDEFWHSNSPKCGGLILRRFHMSYADHGKVHPIYALVSIFRAGDGGCNLGIQFGEPTVSLLTTIKRRDILQALILGEYEEARAMINFVAMIIAVHVHFSIFAEPTKTSEEFVMSLTYEELFHV